MSESWAQIRIWTLGEVRTLLMPAEPPVPLGLLDTRFLEGLRNAAAWARAGAVSCAICGGELGGKASYLAVLMPLDPRMGIGTSSAVCEKCGEAPRGEVLKSVEYSALLMFGPEGGHA